MSYSCRLYKNTGFNATNIPDSINLLNQCQNFTVPALEILQERNLNSIKVKATWDQVKDVDYCILNNNWVYAVVNCTMENTDTANLAVIPDYINSTGGVGALNILDGITDRVHVSDDSYGKYDEDDPLMTPVQPLKVLTEWHTFEGGSNVCVETTLDPIATANGKGKKYTDEIGETEAWVLVPEAKANPKSTAFVYPISRSVNNRGTAIYNMNDNDVKEAIANLRSLGLEQAVISQVKYPSGCVTISMDEDQPKRVGTISGKTNHWPSAFNFIQHSSAKNNRLNYANYEKYGIITCSGDSCEFEPAALYNNSSRPVIDWACDPNPDGKPYFRYHSVNNNTEFMRNCLSGMSWKQVPLLFSGKSGSAIDTMRFQNTSEISKMNFDLAQANGYTQYFNNALSASTGMLNPSVSGLGAGAGAIQDVMHLVRTGWNGWGEIPGGGQTITQAINSINYENQRRSELQDFYISQSIVAPTVMFPYSSDYIRDQKNNGILEYRYVMTDFDKNRIDKLLTMYGYKYTKPLETSDFTNRLYFNFVMAKDVSVTGHAAWINSGISDMLKSGIRIWHVLPNKSYYTNNPIR